MSQRQLNPKFETGAAHIACYMILRRGNKVPFVLRSNTGYMDNFYGLPSGRVEWDEPFIEGAIREAKEEVGVDIKPEDLRHAITVHRRSPDTDWVDIYFEANKWEGEPFNAEPDKHGELAWLDLDNLPENIIPNVRFALGQIANGQTYAERGWAEPTQD